MRGTGRNLRWSQRWSLLVGLLLLAGLVGLLAQADLKALAGAARQLGWPAWATAGVAWLSTYLIRAFRLQQEWYTVRPTPLRRCLQLTLLHNAALTLMPMRTGEVGYLWLVRREWQVGWAPAAHSLARLRGQDLVVLALLAGLAWPGLSWPLRLAHGAAVAGLAFGLWPWVMRQLAGRLPEAWRPPSRCEPSAQRWTGWACSLLNWFVRLAVVAALFVGLGAVSPGLATWAALGGELAAALPLQAPAALGSYEAGVWAATRLVQPVDTPTLVAGAWLVHLFCLAVLLLAAGLAQCLGALLPAEAGALPPPLR